MMVHLRVTVLLALASAACVDPASQTAGKAESPVVYGTDDRLDVYEVDNPELGALASNAIVALVYSSRLLLDNEGLIQFEAQSLREDRKLCSDQRFLEQPVLPFCSGVLIDDDLILTAGHCLESSARSPEEACRETSFVFGFHYLAPDTLSEIAASDVFGCRKLVAFAASGSNREAPDYALVQLDRAPRSRTPARLAAAIGVPGDAAETAALAIGDRVHLIGNGAGLPTKIDSGGRVAGSYGDAYLVADTDGFEGGSGSGVFDASMSLLAIQVRGLYDWQRGFDCTRAAIGSEASEQHLFIKGALDALCEGGYPSQRLCQRQAICGDGVCNGQENAEDCRADCNATCGDGVCVPEERATCAADCAKVLATPPDWTCPPWTYADGARCDCSCGLPDPDCRISGAPTDGCGLGEACNAQGNCDLAIRVAGGGGLPAPHAGGACSVAPGRGNADPPWQLVSALLIGVCLRRRRAHALSEE